MKSEKEKMLAGELYHASDAELVADYRRAQSILESFNASASDADAWRRSSLAELFAHIGKDTVVKPVFRCDYGFNISIGERSFVNYDCVFLDCNLITIGDDVQIAPGVHIFTATHPMDAEIRRSGLEFALPVSIGDSVWLGGGSIVCPGVSIKENTVVGAGSVVTHDLPANVLAVGNPCRVLRKL